MYLQECSAQNESMKMALVIHKRDKAREVRGETKDAFEW